MKSFHVRIDVGWCLRARETKKGMVLISSEGQLILDNNGCHIFRQPTPVDWTDFGAQIENDFHNIFSFVTKNQRVLFVVFMTSPFDIDISMICSKLTQPCIKMCGKLCRNKDYRCFFLCTDWISQHPFRPLVFKDNFSAIAFHIASQLSEFEAIKRVSSIVGRAITVILGHGLTRSANTRGLLSANPAFLQTCSNIPWFLRCDFLFGNICSSQLLSACNVYEAGRISLSASNSYSASMPLPFFDTPILSAPNHE